jgi:hypothetical protein
MHDAKLKTEEKILYGVAVSVLDAGFDRDLPEGETKDLRVQLTRHA